jgi:3-oxoadipate enol-lactonase
VPRVAESGEDLICSQKLIGIKISDPRRTYAALEDTMTGPTPTAGDSALPTLVLIHGAATTSQTWQPQTEALAGQFRVLAPDLPGYGTSPGPFSFDRAAGQITELIGADSTVSVCGISAGATVALQLAAALPEKISSLILSGPELHPPRTGALARSAILAIVPAGVIAHSQPGVTKAAARQAVRALGRTDTRPLLAAVRARTLVLCGTRDRQHLESARTAAGQIPGAELRLIDGAGHLWNTELPAQFTAVIAAWADGGATEFSSADERAHPLGQG